MKLKEIYKKDINRHIEGVIKVDDNANTNNEVDEYVITSEVGKRLETFFEVYSSSINTNITNIGVWLSGFFGSGKSHLLKMISYILENKEIGGKKAGELFIEKVDEAFLKANIQKALTLPTKTILFNIDQKSNIGNQNKAESLLPVFIKVMNELQGFSTIPVVAEFEMDLVKDGIYEEFKSRYEAVSKKNWDTGRKAAFLEGINISKALAEVKDTTTEFTANILDKYKDKVNQVSIEDFALRVKDYISKQDKNFRLIFCVDEMGQFISDNTKLMLNLQTIAESLATKCGNQAWILVTSQEDIESIIGDMNKTQANDFSKIQGRFPTKLNLSSANSDEVIQKRLLVKTEESTSELEKLYEKEKNNFKSLISFYDMPTYQSYKNPENFVYTYPFVPYQFQLFEYSILGLSRHNVFQGRHQSVGERSMLSVFQLVAQEILNNDLGALTTYDKFFDGLRATIRSEAQKPIINAERNLQDQNELAIRVLKTLFLVKYVGNKFKSTKQNISRLLVENFEVDIVDLEKRVQEALNLLEYETYVQQIGGVYEFLTDDEKDIENEIKSTDIELSEVKKELDKYIFDQIMDNKIRFEDNNQDYRFARKIDDVLQGRPEELCINFITPLYDTEVDEIFLKSKSIANRDTDIIIHLKDDAKLRYEIEMVLKTDKYIRINNSPNLKETVRNILVNKSSQNNERKQKLINTIKELISNSVIYLNGSELDIKISDAKTKIKQAFQSLIRNVYLNLKMLDTVYKPEHLNTILLGTGNDIFYTDDSTMSEAEHEMMTHIQRKSINHERITVKSLDEVFSKKPYGWPQIATLCILSKLFMRKKIEVKKDTVELDNKKMISTLNNSKDNPVTFVEPLRTIDNKKVVALKNFHSELFHQQNSELEAKEVHRKFVDCLIEELKELEKLYGKKEQYSFLDDLSNSIKVFKEVISLSYVELYDRLNDYEDKLLDLKEELIDKVKSFMNSDRKIIYDDVIYFLNSENANLGYISSDTDKEVIISLKEEKKPYKSNVIKNAKSALDNIKDLLNQQISKEREESLARVEQFIKRFEDNYEFETLTDSQKEEIVKPFNQVKNRIPNERLISDIRYKVENDLNDIYQRQLVLLNRFIEEKKPKPVNDNVADQEVKPIIKTEIVQLNKVLPRFKKLTLDNEDDVNSYIETLKNSLLQEVRSNKKISL
ncbi:MAG: BREX system P-loop protein BrxC [Candidatus Sericytochromatia bacterium]